MERIFQILEQNAQFSPEQIATMVGMSVTEVERIIKQAERDKTILKYKTIIDWLKLGREEVWALVEVKVMPQKDLGFDSIAEHIYRFPEVHSCYLVSGTYDLAILVRGKNMQEVASFISEKLAPLEKVQSTVTHFLLKRYKDDGEILQPVEEVKRLPIMP
jgi:DNA-binding Lrp family transcriptional regulator